MSSIRTHHQGASTEVWVVDNASSDGTPEMLRKEFPDVRVLASAVNLWFTPSNNAAVRQSASRYVLLLNDDTELLNNAIEKMAAFMESHPQAGACGCALRNAELNLPRTSYAQPSFWILPAHLLGLSRLAAPLRRSGVGAAIARLFGRNVSSYLDSAVPSEPAEVQVISGACLLFRRSVIEAVGEMDDGFKLGPDDWDWCIRIRRAGWKVFLLPDPVVVHAGGVSARRAPNAAALEYYSGWFYFYVKHYGLAGRLLLLICIPPILLMRLLRRAMLCLTRAGRWRELAARAAFEQLLLRALLREALSRSRPVAESWQQQDGLA